MADQALSLKITASDVTASAFNSVKAGLSAIDKAGKKISDNFNNLGKILMAGAAFKGFQTFLDGANEGIGAANRFEASFKGIEEAADSMSKNLQDNFAMTDDEAQNLLSTFNNMSKSMGFSKQASAALSGNMSTLANDMANFARIPVEQAANDLQMALVGNTKALRDYGIVIDDAKIKAEALKQGLGNTKGELSAVEKAFVMQTLIMSEAKDMIGSVATEQDSYVITSKNFKAELNSAGDKIGEFLLPKISDMLKLFKQLPDAVSIVAVALPPLVAAIAALGGPVTAVVIAVTALSYAASQLYKVWADSNEITIEYAQKINDMESAKALLVRTENKVTEAVNKQQTAYKIAMETGNQYNWAQEQAASAEVIRLKGIRNLLNGKIADYQKEVDAVNKKNDDILKAEAKKANKQALLEEKREKERVAAEKKAEKDATEEAQRQIKIAEFIKDAQVAIVVEEFAQKRAALTAWLKEKTILVKGSEEGEKLLKQQYAVESDKINKEELKSKKEVLTKATEAIKEAAAKEKEQRQQVHTHFQNNIASMADSIMTLSMISLNASKDELEYETAKRDMLVETGKIQKGTITEGMKTAEKKVAAERKSAMNSFRIGKAASIANATMTGYESAVNSFNFGAKYGGPILGAAMAVISSAATGLQIAAIAAQPPPFQTSQDMSRMAPGPSNSTTVATLHGGESVSRGGASKIVIEVVGTGDALTAAIANSLRVYQKNTGFELSPA